MAFLRLISRKTLAAHRHLDVCDVCKRHPPNMFAHSRQSVVRKRDRALGQLFVIIEKISLKPIRKEFYREASSSCRISRSNHARA